MFEVGAHIATAIWIMFLPPSPCSFNRISALSKGREPDEGADPPLAPCESEASLDVVPSAGYTPPTPPIRLRSVFIASISARKMWGISSWRIAMIYST